MQPGESRVAGTAREPHQVFTSVAVVSRQTQDPRPRQQPHRRTGQSHAFLSFHL